MKKPIALLLFFTLFACAKAQQSPPTSFALMTPIWKLIGDKTYVQNKNRQMEAVFPAKLKAMNNKVIELPGYLIPIKIGLEFDVCYLSILPVEQCFFCGTNGIPKMVEIHLVKPIRYFEKATKIRGKLVLNETADDRSEVFLVDAQVIE